MGSSGGRVSKEAFGSIAGMAGLFSILTSVIRIAVRLWREKRLRVDDYFLLFACACLGISTFLFYYGMKTVFFLAELVAEPTKLAESGVDQSEIDRQLLIFQTVHRAFLAINWACIFAVKFGFLSFFRYLVDRIPVMYAFWRDTVIFTSIGAAFCIFHSFITCPKVGAASIQCFSQPGAIENGFAVGAATISVDIVTDLLIIMIPLSLIWRVQIKPRQKIGLAAFLCLSISMVIIAIVRISGWRYKDAYDNTWISLWQQVESCVAVAMLSLTAFRSVYVSQPSSKPRHSRRIAPLNQIVISGAQEVHSSDSQRLDDLTIPTAIITDLTTFKGSCRTFQSEDRELDSTRWSAQSVKRPCEV